MPLPELSSLILWSIILPARQHAKFTSVGFFNTMMCLLSALLSDSYTFNYNSTISELIPISYINHYPLPSPSLPLFMFFPHHHLYLSHPCLVILNDPQGLAPSMNIITYYLLDGYNSYFYCSVLSFHNQVYLKQHCNPSTQTGNHSSTKQSIK